MFMCFWIFLSIAYQQKWATKKQQSHNFDRYEFLETPWKMAKAFHFSFVLGPFSYKRINQSMGFLKKKHQSSNN